jgi:transcriptional regulator with XRE-family HTH domain
MAESAPQLQPAPSEPCRARRTEAKPIEPLWRHMLGDRLRSLRHDRGETLGETAARAGVSPQYLSEMERGAKEPSSEMIAAVAGALDVTLLDLTLAVAEGLRSARPAPVQGTARRAMLALAA